MNYRIGRGVLLLVIGATCALTGATNACSDEPGKTEDSSATDVLLPFKPSRLVEFVFLYGAGWVDDKAYMSRHSSKIGDVYRFHLRGCFFIHSIGVVPIADFLSEYRRGVESDSGSDDFFERSIQLFAAQRIHILRNRWEVRPLIGYGWLHEEFVLTDLRTDTEAEKSANNEQGLSFGVETDFIVEGLMGMRVLYTYGSYETVVRRLLIELRLQAFETVGGGFSSENVGLGRFYVSLSFSPTWHESDRIEYLISAGLGVHLIN